MRLNCSIILGLLALSITTACKPSPSPAEEDARRITDPQEWGKSLEEQRQRKMAQQVESGIALPRDFPSPELFATTAAIHREISLKTSRDQTFSNYRELVPAAEASLEMVAIPGGSFMMGSPDRETGRKEDEGPVHEVEVSPFWISAIEIPWEVYTAFMENGRPRTKGGVLLEARPDDEVWDAVTQPTAPYTSMNLGMGHGYEKGMPAIAMSHYAASKFCEWLSAQTGHYYRLPSEAEWEYACRAGAKTPYSYGKDENKLDDYAWYWDNSQDRYQKVASRKPNPWGLFDMHGNVAEWVLDSYDPEAYAKRAGKPGKNPLVLLPGKQPHIVRGGSWDDDPDKLRSAARTPSRPEWNMQDPQNPKSLWYLTNGGMIGFRVVRPVLVPDVMMMHRFWNASKGVP